MTDTRHSPVLVTEDNGVNRQRNSRDAPSSPEPSHSMTGIYALLQEMNERKCQTMLTFIRTEGNMDALIYLQEQIEPIDWELMKNCSTFDLELDYFVSAVTAKEMSKVDLNPIFHRKFDGKLKKINFGFRSNDKNRKKIEKVFDLLGNSGIEEFISDEDIDPEDLENCPYEDSESSFSSEEESTYSESSEDERPQRNNRTTHIPPSLTSSEKPRFANKAQRNRRN